MCNVGVDGLIGGTDLSKAKVVRPARQFPIQSSHHIIGIQYGTATIRLFVDAFHHSFDALLRWPGADVGASGHTIIAAPEGVGEKVKSLLRYQTQMCLVFVHCQFQLLHDPAHGIHGFASPDFAAYYKIIRVVDNVRRPASLTSPLLPSQNEPPHVQIRQ